MNPWRWLGPVALIIALMIAAAGLYAVGLWIPNNPSPTRYPIRGVDVSHHQGSINWSAVKAAGVQFAYIKATEGGDYKDPEFARNWTGSASIGLRHGAYHFFILDTPAAQQAQNFISTVTAEPDALPPAIDLEFSGLNRQRRPARQKFAHELAVFHDALAAHYGKIPVIYTTSDFKEEYLRSMSIERLWIREIFTEPRLGHEPWIFWQFSPRGRMKGMRGYVDLNVFNGTATDIKSLAR